MNFYNDFNTYMQSINANTVSNFRNSVNKVSSYERNRMENYYNCTDDYSFGGIQDDNISRNRIHSLSKADMVEQQLATGKPIRKEIKQLVLVENGEVVSTKIIKTRYGHSFVLDNGYVSLTKNQKTFNKKGYEVKEFTFIVDCFCKLSSGCRYYIKSYSSCIPNKVELEDLNDIIECCENYNEVDYSK